MHIQTTEKKRRKNGLQSEVWSRGEVAFGFPSIYAQMDAFFSEMKNIKWEKNEMTEFAIPKTFNLLGKTIEVRYVPNLINRESRTGQSVYRENSIELQPSVRGYPIPMDSIEQTFFHELVHWILFSMKNEKADSLNDDENFVSLFASLLHQALTHRTTEKE